MSLSDLCRTDSKLLVHLLVLFFGAGAWVAVNGIWVELPIIVDQLPESWNLPSYLTVITQAGNVGPIIVTLMQIFCKKKLDEKKWIYSILLIGTLSCFLLCFVWDKTVDFASQSHSVPLFVLWFFISFVDCTSSVTFLPFMKIFPTVFLTTYFIGEGLSGFLPSIFALIQGASKTNCVNTSMTNQTTNVTTYQIISVRQDPLYSVEVFFGLVWMIMMICSTSFILLNISSFSKRLHLTSTTNSGKRDEGPEAYESVELVGDNREGKCCGGEMNRSAGEMESREGLVMSANVLTRYHYVYFLTIIFITNALSNGVLPSLSSYSALPYGETAYHLSLALGNMANPTACIIALVAPMSSAVGIGFFFIASLGFGSYLLILAVQSPCPVYVNEDFGGAIMVLAQVFWVGLASYVKVSTAQVFRERGHKHCLLWYGAVVQLGSMCGAFTLFPIVQNGYFKMGSSCTNNCSV